MGLRLSWSETLCIRTADDWKCKLGLNFSGCRERRCLAYQHVLINIADMKKFFLWTGVIVLLVPCLIGCWWAYPDWVVSGFVWRHPAEELRTYVLDLKEPDQKNPDFWADKSHCPRKRASRDMA